jgi:hypothetical protein
VLLLLLLLLLYHIRLHLHNLLLLQCGGRLTTTANWLMSRANSRIKFQQLFFFRLYRKLFSGCTPIALHLLI